MNKKIKSEEEAEQLLISLRYRCIAAIQKSVEIHLDIDSPDHVLTNDDNDIFFRMRKCLFHAMMIRDLGVFNDTLPIIAVECRVAMEQFNKIFEMDNQKSYLHPFSPFVHPSPQRLILKQSKGGLSIDNKITILVEILKTVFAFGQLYSKALHLLAINSKPDRSFTSETHDLVNEFNHIFECFPDPKELGVFIRNKRSSTL